jgi:hypothetical protein
VSLSLADTFGDILESVSAEGVKNTVFRLSGWLIVYVTQCGIGLHFLRFGGVGESSFLRNDGNIKVS